MTRRFTESIEQLDPCTYLCSLLPAVDIEGQVFQCPPFTILYKLVESYDAHRPEILDILAVQQALSSICAQGLEPVE